MHNGPMWSYNDNSLEQEEETAPCAGQQSDILTQALQQTLENDSDLLQQLIPETSSTAVSTEPTENVRVPELSSAMNVSAAASIEPTENFMVPEVSPAVNVSCESSALQTPTLCSIRTSAL